MSSAFASMASYWLLPAAEDEVRFLDVIQLLADRHATPRFHPHMTLLGDIARDPAELDQQTRTFAAAIPAFEAQIDDIRTGEAFYRSFYALFPVVPAVAALRSTAAAAFGVDPGPFMPHVSLLYGPVEPQAKEASAAALRARLKGRPIRFDRLALTNSANDVPIEHWEMLTVLPLSG